LFDILKQHLRIRANRGALRLRRLSSVAPRFARQFSHWRRGAKTLLANSKPRPGSDAGEVFDFQSAADVVDGRSRKANLNRGVFAPEAIAAHDTARESTLCPWSCCTPEGFARRSRRPRASSLI